MKKATLGFAVLIIAIVFSTVISFDIRNVRAEGNYAIEHVDHSVKVMYNGYVLINDTVELSGETPSSFFLGFPYTFGPYVLQSLAFDANNRSNTFPVNLDKPLENRSGFYALEVDLSEGATQNFTILVLLSNALVIQNPDNATIYYVTFPVYPSLEKTAGTCNSSIVLPKNAAYVSGAVSSLNYGEKNLTAFTYNASAVIFNVAGEEMQIFDVDQLNRDLRIGEFGDITGSDSYYITNKASNPISSVEVLLPAGALEAAAEDQFGRTMSTPELAPSSTNRYSIKLSKQLDPGKSTRFAVSYRLPSGTYIQSRSGNGNFVLNMTLFQDLDYYVNGTTVTFALPEGAELQTFEDTLSSDLYSISKDVFQEKVAIGKQGMIWLDTFNVEVAYTYNALWSAFRPTVWVLVVAMLGCVAVVVLRRPKAPAPVAVPTTALGRRPEYIKSFVESYQDKMKIVSEIDSLEDKARKGRIPRQRYKVQRKTLETRLDTLSRNLAELKEKLRSVGSHYASLMRELEVAEIEINEVETNVKSIEARHSRGELSLEGYRRLLGDYLRRKEKTETTINGILLRLREEIR